MSTPSSRLQWPVPDKGADPWYDQFTSLIGGIDSTTYSLVEDRNLTVTGGGNILYSGSTLTWTNPIQIFPTANGYTLTINAGTLTGVTAGTLWMVDLVRAPTQNITLTSYTGTQVNSLNNTLVLGFCDGNTIHMRSMTPSIAAYVSSKQTEILTAIASGWTQIDIHPLALRSGIEISNNDPFQDIGVICTSSIVVPTDSETYSTGRIVHSNTTTPLLPASPSIKIYVRTQTGPQFTGAATILNEWA